MSARPTSRVASICLVVAVGACATSKEARDQHQIEVMRKEGGVQELIGRGEAAASLGDLTRAEQYFVAALRAGGPERALTQRLIVICTNDQRYPAALEYAETYLRRHPNDTEVRFASGTIYAATGDSDRAEASFERVLAERPDWPEAHYALASLLRDHGTSFANADRHFREYIRLSPNGTYAEAARGYLMKSIR